ncbi:hypothetical protein ECANGB1_1146 [Enterospora canceri]|uniref:Uncharacterized protein n=1 Tax=Enterospora canceri TaxID=1081671 RepID=A0A1Y1S6P2_9MICR|nr:hypothetical protein ECANGB1_1146 [Enterospora canceri]
MLICQILTVLSALLKIVENKNNNDPCFFHNCFWNKHLGNEFSINELTYTNDELEIQFYDILNQQILAPYRDQLNRDQLKACEECIESFKLISEWYFSDYNSLKCFYPDLIHTKPTISLIYPSDSVVQIKLAIPVRNEQTITFQENGARYLLGMHILDDYASYMNILRMSFHKVYFETDWKTTIVSFKFALISEWYFSDYNSLKCFYPDLIHTKPTISLIYPSDSVVQIKLAIPVRNEQTITFQENGARYLLGMHILDDYASYMNILRMSFHKVYFETDWKTTIVSFKFAELTNSPRVLFRHPMRIETELLLKIFEGFATYNNVRIYGNAKISQDFPYLKNRFSTVIQFSDDYKFKDNNDLPELKQIEEPKKENNQIQVPQKKKNTMLVIVILLGVVIVLVAFVNYKIMKKTV